MRKSLLSILLFWPAIVLAQMPQTKMAEIRGEGQWHFIMRLPETIEFQIFISVVVLGALGTFFNYAVKWMKNEIAGSLWVYLFRDNVRGTLLAFTMAVGAGAGAISAGAFEAPSGEFIGWFTAWTACFGNGFFWDNVVNKGSAPNVSGPSS